MLFYRNLNSIYQLKLRVVIKITTKARFFFKLHEIKHKMVVKYLFIQVGKQMVHLMESWGVRILPSHLLNGNKYFFGPRLFQRVMPTLLSVMERWPKSISKWNFRGVG